MSFQEHIAEKQADSGTKSSSVQHKRLQALKHMSIVGRVGRVQHACITWSCIYHMVFMECLRALNLQTRLFSSRVTNSSTLDTYRALRQAMDTSSGWIWTAPTSVANVLEWMASQLSSTTYPSRTQHWFSLARRWISERWWSSRSLLEMPSSFRVTCCMGGPCF